MPRIRRLRVPHIPYHVVARGNRRQTLFFDDGDRALYLALVATLGRSRGLALWGYCLMDNHVHLVVVPRLDGSLSSGIGDVHQAYARHVNARHGWRGHLWEYRFGSFAMDDRHAVAALRYVELNPVRACLVSRAHEYRWSSARHHCLSWRDPALDPCDLLPGPGQWMEFLAAAPDQHEVACLQVHSRTGRPLGSDQFVKELETSTGRSLAPRTAGRPRKPGIKRLLGDRQVPSPLG